MSTYTLNTTNLDKLLKALKGRQPVARVGILGEGAFRSNKEKGGPNNATVGAFHEFGTSKLPVRSFLRMPISLFLDKYLKKSGAFNKDVMREVLQNGTIMPWLKKVAVVAETVVIDAFDSNGFGTWVPSQMTGKKNHQTLVETGQLRGAITSDVVEGN